MKNQRKISSITYHSFKKSISSFNKENKILMSQFKYEEVLYAYCQIQVDKISKTLYWISVLV